MPALDFGLLWMQVVVSATVAQINKLQSDPVIHHGFENNLKRLTRLVNDLLDVSKIEEGKLKLRRSSIELCDMIDKIFEESGLALEGLVMQHLRAWNDYIGTPYSLHYWRTRSGAEVDFIVYGEKGFWAIEVKNNKNVYTKDVRHLNAFCEDYPEATPLLLYRGTERHKIKDVLCLPVEDFLKTLNPEKDIIDV